MFGNGIFGEHVAFGAVADDPLGQVPVNGSPHIVTTGQSCGSMKAVQQMLNDLGFDAGAVDGMGGPKTFGALKAFAAQAAAPYAGSYPSGPLCQLLYQAWSMRGSADAPVTAPVDPAAPPPDGGAGAPMRPMLRLDASRLQAILRARAAATPAPAGGGFWANASTTTKVGIIAAGVLVVGVVGYLAFGGSKSFTKNFTPNGRKRFHRKKKSNAQIRLDNAAHDAMRREIRRMTVSELRAAKAATSARSEKGAMIREELDGRAGAGLMRHRTPPYRSFASNGRRKRRKAASRKRGPRRPPMHKILRGAIPYGQGRVKRWVRRQSIEGLRALALSRATRPVVRSARAAARAELKRRGKTITTRRSR